MIREVMIGATPSGDVEGRRSIIKLLFYTNTKATCWFYLVLFLFLREPKGDVKATASYHEKGSRLGTGLEFRVDLIMWC